MKSPQRTPWGYWTVLFVAPDYKVKRLWVKPGKRTSLQSHEHRSEHWVVVEGSVTVTVNDRSRVAHRGEFIYVPVGAKHRIENHTGLGSVIVETWIGDSHEDDIVRYEDDFGRV